MTVGELNLSSGFQAVKPEQVKGPKTIDRSKPGQPRKVQSESFSKVLESELTQREPLRFSAHALSRMQERNLQLSAEGLSRLHSGVERVESKGSRDSLILMDDNAYIVSVKQHTVITAMNREASLNNVFTNIDSVAIV